MTLYKKLHQKVLTACVLLKSWSKNMFRTVITAYELSPPLMILPLLSLFQEIELREACFYGLVGQVCDLLTTGVCVNRTTFVSGQPDRDLGLGGSL